MKKEFYDVVVQVFSGIKAINETTNEIIGFADLEENGYISRKIIRYEA